MDFLRTLNPLIINRHMIPILKIMDPMDNPMDNPMDERFRFSDYMKLVNELQSFVLPVPVSPSVHGLGFKSVDNDDLSQNADADYTKIPGPLFIYNGSQYYGYREVVYDSILCLKEIKDVADFDQLITLSGRLPKYAINLWIWSMYSKQFNIMKIRPHDIVGFLNHIDQYPTDFLTIGSIECGLIRYLDTCTQNIVKDLIPCLNQISMRCRLKRLYLWIHNKQNNQ